MSLTALKPSRSMNSSDSGGPVRTARLVSRRSDRFRYRELYRRVRSSVTDSASARFEQSARSRAPAPPARAAADQASQDAGASAGSAREDCAIEPDQRADGAVAARAAGSRRRRPPPPRLRQPRVVAQVGAGEASPLCITQPADGLSRPAPAARASALARRARRAARRRRRSRRPSTGAGHQVGAHETRNSATRSGSSVACVACSTCASANASLRRGRIVRWHSRRRRGEIRALAGRDGPGGRRRSPGDRAGSWSRCSLHAGGADGR